MHPNIRVLAILACTSLAAASPLGANLTAPTGAPAIAARNIPATLKVPSANFPTIAAAVIAANSGDTIQIAPNDANGSGGVYSEVIVVPNTKTGLHFKGSNAIWDGGAANDILTFAGPNDDVTVEGFQFRNGAAQLIINGDHATVTNCQFVNAGANSVTIVGNFAAVTGLAIHGAFDSGIFINGTDAFVDKCTLEGTNLAAIGFNAGDRGIVSNCKILKCDGGITFTGNDMKLLKNTMSEIGASAITGTGLNSDIEKNKISIVSIVGISLNSVSDDAKIIGNTIDAIQNAAITVDGSQATISKNKIEDCLAGILVSNGSSAILGGPTISANRIKFCRSSDAIRVSADSVTILANTIDHVNNNGDGIDVASLGLGVQGGLIANNRISSVGARGVFVTGNSITVSQNSISHVGRSFFDNAGIRIVGNGNSLIGNSVNSVFGDGYLVSGNTNTLAGCNATNCTSDGIDLVAGDGNVVDDCSVTSCGAEGFDNSNGVTNSVVKNSSFSKCRIDFAGNGTLAQDVNNTFKTGGPGTAPVID